MYCLGSLYFDIISLSFDLGTHVHELCFSLLDVICDVNYMLLNQMQQRHHLDYAIQWLCDGFCLGDAILHAKKEALRPVGYCACAARKGKIGWIKLQSHHPANMPQRGVRCRHHEINHRGVASFNVS